MLFLKKPATSKAKREKKKNECEKKVQRFYLNGPPRESKNQKNFTTKSPQKIKNLFDT